ncbi:MAG TPA: L,D-transpeptidase [Chthoniobacterales bacterium]|nr:L,D-transpeptidase [Chthoniobacterales bacterium]
MVSPRVFACGLLALSASAVSAQVAPVEVRNEVIVSVREQKLMLLQNGAKVKTYPISTSKFGLGDGRGTMTTPVGTMAVAQKIGDYAPLGTVFKKRQWTGEILPPNAPGRDPIVTRILWLRGVEPSTAHAFSRCIYIHGTPEERTIGRPASYGCIRMKSTDVVDLYTQLPVGALVKVVEGKLPRVAKARVVYRIKAPDAPVERGRPLPYARTPAPSQKNATSATARLAKNA